MHRSAVDKKLTSWMRQGCMQVSVKILPDEQSVEDHGARMSHSLMQRLLVASTYCCNFPCADKIIKQYKAWVVDIVEQSPLTSSSRVLFNQSTQLNSEARVIPFFLTPDTHLSLNAPLKLPAICGRGVVSLDPTRHVPPKGSTNIDQALSQTMRPDKMCSDQIVESRWLKAEWKKAVLVTRLMESYIVR